MELVNTNDENFFDPIPRLKSSPIPIQFISFGCQHSCVYCGEKYIETLLCSRQKYCKKCLSRYINDIIDDNIYFEIYYYTIDSECNGHEINKIKVPQSNKEFCGNCLRISFFKQIEGYFDKCYLDNDILDIYNKVTESEKHCKLCGKSLFQETADKYIIKQFKLCSDCYLISFEWIESTLVKKQILILYLPWWHNTLSCDLCYSLLLFTSDCQKYCRYCLIFYTGCRYCLTTNIIFGPTGQSQCKKCKRISFIIDIIEYRDLDDILLNETIHRGLYFDNIANIVKTTDKYFDPVILIYSMFKKYNRVKPIRWISYSQFTDVKEMTKGGYGIIYTL